jgi:formylglycine-generating enzyme required for sulfatase activity
MKTAGHCLVIALFALAPAASAVEIDWTFVGDPGNPCENQSDIYGDGCYGTVDYHYNIGTYEVTNAQYAEFLNAKAATDSLELYNANMGDPNPYSFGGITRSGVPGSYSYSAIAGRENMPVNWVSLFDAMRFANWLSNDQGNGDTETGSYTLLGGAPVTNLRTVTRNPAAVIFVANEDEWYKAAFYEASSASYLDYPASSNTHPQCSAPGSTPNRANCGGAVGDLTPAGSYTGSASPYSTFDQGGNVWEWNEDFTDCCSPYYRRMRGGSYEYDSTAASFRSSAWPREENRSLGFRVAPEPTRGLLLGAGLALLVALERLRRRG